MIPLCRRSFPVADDLDYAAPRWLNPDFARLTRNKSIAKSRAGTVSFSNLERLERTSHTIVGGFSQLLVAFFPAVTAEAERVPSLRTRLV